MAGGARRDVLTGVVDADWIPGTDALAVIRDPGGGRPWTVEFPAGTTVHEARAAWSLRVSPDGSRVAFFEGPLLFDSAPEAMITVIDKSGRKSTVARNWAGFGLAWAPSGTEIWFTATRPAPGESRRTCLPSRSRESSERCIARPIGSCCTTSPRTAGCCCLETPFESTWRASRQADTRERDLTWLLASSVTGLSPDGETVIFEDELLSSPSGNPTILRRNMDGSPAVPIGEGSGAALSPDGKWVLASSGREPGPLADRGWRDGHAAEGKRGAGRRRNVARRLEAHCLHGRPRRQQVERLHSGNPGRLPRAITPEGVVLAGKAAVRDDNSILGRVGATWMLFPIQGGDGQPVPALTPGDIPLQWSHDGRYVYTVDNVEGARPAAVDVFRVELATGGRTLWKTLTPSDPVGVEDMRETRRDHPGRAVVLLLLHATAWRPVRGRRAQVTSAAAG